MRIYDGSPRQDFEEVLRSIGAYLDGRGMKDILLMEAPDGFIVQGLSLLGGSSGAWTDTDGAGREGDDELPRRGHRQVHGRVHGQARVGPQESPVGVGRYEHAFRVIGRYIDEQHPKDIFFFEQHGAFLLRLHHQRQTGSSHELVEFTREDVEALIAQGPTLRIPPQPTDPHGAGRS